MSFKLNFTKPKSNKSFSVELVEKLDALAKVSIKTGGEGFGDKWKLAKIEFTAVDPATNVAKGAKQVFNFNQCNVEDLVI